MPVSRNILNLRFSYVPYSLHSLYGTYQNLRLKMFSKTGTTSLNKPEAATENTGEQQSWNSRKILQQIHHVQRKHLKTNTILILLNARGTLHFAKGGIISSLKGSKLATAKYIPQISSIKVNGYKCICRGSNSTIFAFLLIRANT